MQLAAYSCTPHAGAQTPFPWALLPAPSPIQHLPSFDKTSSPWPSICPPNSASTWTIQLSCLVKKILVAGQSSDREAPPGFKGVQEGLPANLCPPHLFAHRDLGGHHLLSPLPAPDPALWPHQRGPHHQPRGGASPAGAEHWPSHGEEPQLKRATWCPRVRPGPGLGAGAKAAELTLPPPLPALRSTRCCLCSRTVW